MPDDKDKSTNETKTVTVQTIIDKTVDDAYKNKQKVEEEYVQTF